MNTVKHPHRVRAELPSGGVLLEPVCALCHEVNDAVSCPICDRLFCVEACFEVHLNARDSYDSEDAIRTFLRTPEAHALLSTAFADVKKENGEPVDWRHALTCEDCNADLRDTIVRLLLEGVDEIRVEEAATCE